DGGLCREGRETATSYRWHGAVGDPCHAERPVDDRVEERDDKGVDHEGGKTARQGLPARCGEADRGRGRSPRQAHVPPIVTRPRRQCSSRSGYRTTFVSSLIACPSGPTT